MRLLGPTDQPLRFAATLSPTGLNHLYAFDLSLSLLLLLLQLEPEMAAVEVERDLWEQQARQRLVRLGAHVSLGVVTMAPQKDGCVRVQVLINLEFHTDHDLRAERTATRSRARSAAY